MDKNMNEKEERRMNDPSANVLMLVGNATKYLEDLHKQGVESAKDRLEAAVIASQRERASESERINSLRLVDVQAVATANDRAIKQAEVLATQVAASAEALRILVAQTASTIANQLAEVTNQLISRIAALEKAQYEGVGRSGNIDALPAAVQAIKEALAESKGKQGISIQLIMAIAVAFVGIAVFIIETIIRSGAVK